MKKTRRKLRSLKIVTLTVIMCFALLMGQNSSEEESNFTKSVWRFFMGRTYLVTPSVDGYFWRKMSETQKYGYITGYARGFKEGVASAWIVATGNTKLPFDLFLERMSYDDFQEAANEFYSDYANRGICLSLALPIIISRVSGYIGDEEAKDRIQKARRVSLKIPKEEQ